MLDIPLVQVNFSCQLETGRPNRLFLSLLSILYSFSNLLVRLYLLVREDGKVCACVRQRLRRAEGVTAGEPLHEEGESRVRLALHGDDLRQGRGGWSGGEG